MTVRPARADDSPAMAVLHADAFARGWSVAEFADLAGDEAAVCLVEEAGGRVTGFVAARIAADEAEVLTLAIETQARRRGIASALIAGVASAAAARGARILFLDVAADNMAAQALYAGAGFTEIARRPGYYTSGRAGAQDAIVLARTLRVDAAAQRS